MSGARVGRVVLLALALAASTRARASAADADSAAVTVAPDSADVVADDTLGVRPVADAPAAARVPARRDGLVALVPALASDAYGLAPGPRPYVHRLVVTPSAGRLGSDRLFLLRVAYSPCAWLGYEAEVGHAPDRVVNAILHRFNLVLRRPFPGRLQPFVDAGYGMVVVLPGRSVNADAVTRNVLATGGGLEFYLRDDLALRAEMRRSTVFGNQANRSGLVAYDYAESTLGLEFHRFLQP